MTRKYVDVSSVRKANDRAFRAALAGEMPDETILVDAEALGDAGVALECRVCRVVALSAADDARATKVELEPILADVAAGTKLGKQWRWVLEHVVGITADEFSDFDTAWASHYNALEIAHELGEERRLSVSELYLGYTHYRLDMREDALARLVGALSHDAIPEQAEIVAECLVGLVLSDMGEEALARQHWDQAMLLVRQAQEPVTSSSLRILITLASKAPDFLAVFSEVEAWRARSNTLRSRSGFELDLWQVRAARHAGKRAEALAGAQLLLTQIGNDLAFRGEVAVVLVEILISDADYEAALVALEDPSLQPPPPFYELAMVDAQRLAFKKLGRWEEAAQCFNTARQLHRKRRFGSTSIYEIQVKAAQDRRLTEQTRELEIQKAELENVVEEQTIMSELILNKIQSPMTSLQLILDLLVADQERGPDPYDSSSALEDPSTVHHIGLARRAVRRMTDVVLEIRQSAALEGIRLLTPEQQNVGLHDALTRIVLTQRVYLADHSMTLELASDSADSPMVLDLESTHHLLGALIRGIVEFGPTGARILMRATIGEPGKATIVLTCNELRLPEKYMVLLEGVDAEGDSTGRTVGQPDRKGPVQAMEGRELLSEGGISEPGEHSERPPIALDLASDLSFPLALKISNVGGFGLHAKRRTPSGTSFTFELGKAPV